MPDVIVIQHVDVEGPGRIGEALDARGLRWRRIRADLGEEVPEDATGLAGVVVMGGPMGVHEAARHAFLSAERRLLENAVARGVPTLGICLGSQLLASALGARVYRGSAKEIGWLPVHLSREATGDGLLACAPTTFAPLHWHGDAFDVPAGAAPLARSDLTACQAFRAGPTAWGLLFHLEVTAEQVSAMAGRFRDELAGAGVDARTLVEESRSASGAVEELARDVFGRWAAIVASPGQGPLDSTRARD